MYILMILDHDNGDVVYKLNEKEPELSYDDHIEPISLANIGVNIDAFTSERYQTPVSFKDFDNSNNEMMTKPSTLKCELESDDFEMFSTCECTNCCMTTRAKKDKAETFHFFREEPFEDEPELIYPSQGFSTAESVHRMQYYDSNEMQSWNDESIPYITKKIHLVTSNHKVGAGYHPWRMLNILVRVYLILSKHSQYYLFVV